MRYRVVIRGDITIDPAEIAAFVIRTRLDLKARGLEDPRSWTVEAALAERNEEVPEKFRERGVADEPEHTDMRTRRR